MSSAGSATRSGDARTRRAGRAGGGTATARLCARAGRGSCHAPRAGSANGIRPGLSLDAARPCSQYARPRGARSCAWFARPSRVGDRRKLLDRDIPSRAAPVYRAIVGCAVLLGSKVRDLTMSFGGSRTLGDMFGLLVPEPVDSSGIPRQSARRGSRPWDFVAHADQPTRTTSASSCGPGAPRRGRRYRLDIRHKLGRSFDWDERERRLDLPGRLWRGQATGRHRVDHSRGPYGRK